MFSRRVRAPFAMLALSTSIAAFAADEGTHAITIYSKIFLQALTAEDTEDAEEGQKQKNTRK